jgi:hypothetical protein
MGENSKENLSKYGSTFAVHQTGIADVHYLSARRDLRSVGRIGADNGLGAQCCVLLKFNGPSASFK